MPKKIRTEADRIATPPPVPMPGSAARRNGPRGQKVSLERGAHTNNKKNPGKRPKKGG